MSTREQAFGLYSQYYDLLYQDKDYHQEADYVATLISEHAPDAKSVLELGCGTGIHAELLTRRGFEVTGVERSHAMFQRAETRANQLTDRSFSVWLGDAQSFNSEKAFDAVISLFHVVSYQVDADALGKFFETVAKHLVVGGIFIFDVWYGPAVLTQRPTVRVKRMMNDSLSVVRIAEPELMINQNVARVDYQIFAKRSDDESYQSMRETHLMRYFFLPEIESLVHRFGMSVESKEEWLTRNALSDQTWGACFVVKKSAGRIAE